MSGGYFNRNTYAMREIADAIERDIAKGLYNQSRRKYKRIIGLFTRKIALAHIIVIRTT